MTSSVSVELYGRGLSASLQSTLSATGIRYEQEDGDVGRECSHAFAPERVLKSSILHSTTGEGSRVVAAAHGKASRGGS